MLNRIGPQRGRHGPLDEDAAPGAAAVLAALTDPVPAHAQERPLAHLGRLAWRAAGLVAVAGLAYLPTLLDAGLLDGEVDNMRRLQAPRLAQADLYRVPLSLLRYPAATPWALRHLVHVEARLGDSAASHHAVGLCLHAAAAVLLWLVLRRVARPAAWLAAALFAANPGAAAAVEWFGQRGRLWAACLALLGAGLLLRSLGVPARPPAIADRDEDDEPTGVRRWLGGAAGPAGYVLALLAFVAAALVQPTAAAVGVVAVLLAVWRKRMTAADWAAVAPVLVLAGVVAVTVVARPAGPTLVPGLPVPLRPLWETGRAVERVAWPFASADLLLPGQRRRAVATCGLGGAVWVALAAAAALRRRVGVGPAVAVASFVLLVPTAVVPPAVAAVPGLSEATQASAAATYLAAVPALVVLADAVVAACRRVRADLGQRLAEVAAAAAALAGLGGWTAVRSAAYGNTESVLQTAIAVNHRSWPARAQLAEWDLTKGQPDAALEALDGLTTDNCPDAVTAIAEGDLLQTDGDLTTALAWYRRAGVLDPDDAAAVGRQSAVYLRLDRVGDAIDTYELALAQHPDSAELHVQFGLLLSGQDDPSPAAEQFRQALRVDPDAAATHVNLANALFRQGQKAAADQPQQASDLLLEAAGQLQQAVNLDPENVEAYHNAGVILTQLREYDPAARMLTAAVQLRPDSPEYRNDLGVALVSGHKYRPAEFELTEALRLRPDYADAKHNLEVAKRMAAAEQRRANVEGK